MAPLPEIKPCPFCGYSASVEEVPQGSIIDPKAVRFTVGCDNPAVEDCMGYQSLSDFDRRSEAIEAWNRRAPVATAHRAALIWAANAIMAQDVGDPTTDTGWKSDEALAHWLTIRALLGDTIKPPGQSGGPTVEEPDRPYCNPDQSCCDFACGN